jgi:peroxiredoxin
MHACVYACVRVSKCVSVCVLDMPPPDATDNDLDHAATGFLEGHDALKAAGVDTIACLATNDP